MKSVLHIIWSSNFGGIESLVFNLSIEQKKHGDFIPSIFSATKGGDLLSKAEMEGIKTISGNFIKNKFNLNSLKFCKELFSNYDILHIHSFNPIICLAAIKSNRPVIYTEHGNFGFHKKINLLQKINNKFLKHYLNSNVQIVSFNSEFTQNIAIKKYGLAKVNKKIIYNGISSSENNALLTDSKVNENLLGTVGRLAKVKKIDRIIRSISHLPKELDFSLEVIGDGPELNYLINLSKNLDIENKIQFRGFQADVNQFYKNWSLMIVASSGEAFGLVVLEAYKFGLPVAIFKDGGGMIEIVNQVDPKLILDNEIQLTELLNEWPKLKNHYHTTELINKRKKIVESFSIEKTRIEFEILYKEISCAV